MAKLKLKLERAQATVISEMIFTRRYDLKDAIRFTERAYKTQSDELMKGNLNAKYLVNRLASELFDLTLELERLDEIQDSLDNQGVLPF